MRGKKETFACLIFDKICYVLCMINHADKMICLHACLHKHDRMGVTDKPAEISLGMHFHAQTWHKNYPSIFTWHNATRNVVSSRWQVRSEKARKGWAPTLTTATTRVHLLKFVLTNLTKSDSVLTNPIGKGWLV